MALETGLLVGRDGHHPGEDRVRFRVSGRQLSRSHSRLVASSGPSSSSPFVYLVEIDRRTAQPQPARHDGSHGRGGRRWSFAVWWRQLSSLTFPLRTKSDSWFMTCTAYTRFPSEFPPAPASAWGLLFPTPYHTVLPLSWIPNGLLNYCPRNQGT